MNLPSQTLPKPIWVEIFSRLAAERGLRLHVEPLYGYAGFIERPDGSRHFFKGTNFDLNGAGAAALAKDKDYAGRFLAEAGLPVPQSLLVHSARRRAAMALKNPAVAARLPGEAAAMAFAATVGWPVYVKPNEGSEGEGVARVDDERALRRHLDMLFALNDRVLVQQAVGGADHRVIVLDGMALAVFRRSPFSITGDGRRDIGSLAQSAVDGFKEQGKGARIDVADARIADYLAAGGRSLDYVPAKGEVVALLANANLSTGGSAADVSATIGEDVKCMAVAAARALGLRFAGVDLLLDDKPDGGAIVLEVNAGPGLSYFHRLGADEAATVEAIYGRVMDAILEPAAVQPAAAPPPYPSPV